MVGGEWEKTKADLTSSLEDLDISRRDKLEFEKFADLQKNSPATLHELAAILDTFYEWTDKDGMTPGVIETDELSLDNNFSKDDELSNSLKGPQFNKLKSMYDLLIGHWKEAIAFVNNPSDANILHVMESADSPDYYNYLYDRFGSVTSQSSFLSKKSLVQEPTNDAIVSFWKRYVVLGAARAGKTVKVDGVIVRKPVDGDSSPFPDKTKFLIVEVQNTIGTKESGHIVFGPKENLFNLKKEKISGEILKDQSMSAIVDDFENKVVNLGGASALEYYLDQGDLLTQGANLNQLLTVIDTLTAEQMGLYTQSTSDFLLTAKTPYYDVIYKKIIQSVNTDNKGQYFVNYLNYLKSNPLHIGCALGSDAMANRVRELDEFVSGFCSSHASNLQLCKTVGDDYKMIRDKLLQETEWGRKNKMGEMLENSVRAGKYDIFVSLYKLTKLLFPGMNWGENKDALDGFLSFFGISSDVKEAIMGIFKPSTDQMAAINKSVEIYKNSASSISLDIAYPHYDMFLNTKLSNDKDEFTRIQTSLGDVSVISQFDGSLVFTALQSLSKDDKTIIPKDFIEKKGTKYLVKESVFNSHHFELAKKIVGWILNDGSTIKAMHQYVWQKYNNLTTDKKNPDTYAKFQARYDAPTSNVNRITTGGFISTLTAYCCNPLYLDTNVDKFWVNSYEQSVSLTPTPENVPTTSIEVKNDKNELICSLEKQGENYHIKGMTDKPVVFGEDGRVDVHLYGPDGYKRLKLKKESDGAITGTADEPIALVEANYADHIKNMTPQDLFTRVEEVAFNLVGGLYTKTSDDTKENREKVTYLVSHYVVGLNIVNDLRLQAFDQNGGKVSLKEGYSLIAQKIKISGNDTDNYEFVLKKGADDSIVGEPLKFM